MKKKGLLIVLLVVARFTLTGCITKKALSSAEVKAIVEKEGFTATEDTESYQEYDHIKEVLELGNTNFYLQFFVISDVEKAKTLFNNNKELIDNNREGNYTNSSLSGKNYETYELISGGYYMYVSRVDNTLVYVMQKEEYKDEIKKIIKALKY